VDKSVKDGVVFMRVFDHPYFPSGPEIILILTSFNYSFFLVITHFIHPTHTPNPQELRPKPVMPSLDRWKLKFMYVT
jgi:hypothetical protein